MTQEIAATVEGVEIGFPDKSDAATTRCNWSNLTGYLANLVITFVSLTGCFGQTNTALSEKYQTLITPAGYAFSIWGAIFIWEAIFVLAQFFPVFRQHPVVQASSPWWLATCGFQIAWTLVFAQEVIWLSLVCMIGILVSLTRMAYLVDRMPPLSAREYLCLRAPFALHLGWIICASVVNLNVVVDSQRHPPAVMLGFAIAAFVIVVLYVLTMTFAFKSPEPWIGFVAAWALAAIFSELKNPVRLRNPTRYNAYDWDDQTLSDMRTAAGALAIITLVHGLGATVWRIVGFVRLARVQSAGVTTNSPA